MINIKVDSYHASNETKTNKKNDITDALNNWRFAIEYGIKYQKHIKKEAPLSSEELRKLKRITSQSISTEFIRYIELFCQLDKEVVNYCIPEKQKHPLTKSKKKFRDTQWRGFWLKSTGNDFSLFINWIKSGIKYEKYKEKSLVHWFKEEWKKQPKDVPYCIKMADYIFHKYYGYLCE